MLTFLNPNWAALIQFLHSLCKNVGITSQMGIVALSIDIVTITVYTSYMNIENIKSIKYEIDSN